MRIAGTLAAVGLAFGVTPPASATPCVGGACVTVVVFSSVARVCDAVPGGDCSYRTDPVWEVARAFSHNDPPSQGLYSLGIGPPATGPFRVGGVAPGALCVDARGVCELSLSGSIGPGLEGIGAYCERWSAEGTGTLASGGSSLRFTFEWRRAPLPLLVGTVTESDPPGREGAPVAGLITTRGADGNCGITQPSRSFTVEGLLAIG